MAILIMGPMVAEARGSIGGTVFSRNRAGAIARQRVVPVNPQTARQNAVRVTVQQLQSAWRDLLTPDQRSGWENYAESSSPPNRVGLSNRITGVNAFIRSNSIKLRAAEPLVLDAPSAFGAAVFPIITYDGTTVVGLRATTVTPALAAGDILQFLVSGARPLSRNFFKGPYDTTEFFVGVAAPPYVLIPPAGVVAGTRHFVRARLVLANGQVSQDFGHTQDIS